MKKMFLPLAALLVLATLLLTACGGENPKTSWAEVTGSPLTLNGKDGERLTISIGTDNGQAVIYFTESWMTESVIGSPSERIGSYEGIDYWREKIGETYAYKIRYDPEKWRP